MLDEAETQNTFKLVNNILKVEESRFLDFERSKTISVLIQCSDSGIPKYSLKKQISIIIQDVNEPPVSISLSKAMVVENAKSETIVGKINVKDPDRNQIHFCNLLKNSFNTFKISENILKVKENKYLNYEFITIMYVFVQCNDSGTPMQSIKKQLSINITDVNERPHYLSLSNYRVAENAANKLVGTLRTRDPDQIDVKFFYELVRGMEFFILITNQLFTKTQLNYEKKSSYEIEIRSTDCAGRLKIGFI